MKGICIDLPTELWKNSIECPVMMRLQTHRQATTWWHLGSILMLEVHIDLNFIDYLISGFHSFIDWRPQIGDWLSGFPSIKKKIIQLFNSSFGLRANER